VRQKRLVGVGVDGRQDCTKIVELEWGWEMGRGSNDKHGY
jgi:hypothetical protein